MPSYDITNTNVSSNNAGALALPLWFIEGLAEYLSIGPVDPHTAMWMREAARREKLPKIKDLDNPRYFPYRYGPGRLGLHRREVRRPDHRRHAPSVAGTQRHRGRVSRGFSASRKKELTELWHQAEFAAYKPIAEVTQMPGAFARPVIVNDKGGRLNPGPELSPDGSKIMFFSERDLFSIDLFLADAKTGKVIEKDHRHRHQPALREPPVPGVGRVVGGRAGVRLPASARGAGAHDRQRPTARG